MFAYEANQTGQAYPPKVTYDQCVQSCGGGIGQFNWPMFFQGFTSTLLPWFALISQLPFGAAGM